MIFFLFSQKAGPEASTLTTGKKIPLTTREAFVAKEWTPLTTEKVAVDHGENPAGY